MLEKNDEQCYILRPNDSRFINDDLDIVQKIVEFDDMVLKLLNKKDLKECQKKWDYCKNAEILDKEFCLDIFWGTDETLKQEDKSEVYEFSKAVFEVLDDHVFAEYYRIWKAYKKQEPMIPFIDDELSANCRIAELNRIALEFMLNEGFVKYYRIWKLYKAAKTLDAEVCFDKLVGIDEIGYAAAYLLNANATYYSLEISQTTLNRFIFAFLEPKLLIIQSVARKDYLSKKNINTIYIQNSPILEECARTQKKYKGNLI
jgi:hypothetical protein